MANRTKIRDMEQVRRWFEDGWTMADMRRFYLENYHEETSPAMWTAIRRRLGYDSPIVHDPDLMPWSLAPEHRHLFPAKMLRAEARVRAGKETARARELQLWKAKRQELGQVVYYDAKWPEGFYYVPREPGDGDLVARPGSRELLPADAEIPGEK